jgi:hypothetical protein
VKQVRVDQIRLQAPEAAREAADEHRIEMMMAVDGLDGDAGAARGVAERGGVVAGVVDDDQARLDAVLGQRGEQLEQMPLGAGDPSHLADVRDTQRRACHPLDRLRAYARHRIPPASARN